MEKEERECSFSSSRFLNNKLGDVEVLLAFYLGSWSIYSMNILLLQSTKSISVFIQLNVILNME